MGWFQLYWSSADVSCHVLAALPVPLGQCDCHPAVSGHFLRHHPTASWDKAWADHNSYDWWVFLYFLSYLTWHIQHRNGYKNTFWIISIYFHCLLSTATVCWVWLLKCLIRFLRENISPLYFSLYFINILVINKLFSRQIAQGLTFIKICTT